MGGERMQVIKIGGNEFEKPGFIENLAEALRNFDEPPVIVHGGGSAVDALQDRLGLKPVKVQGLRRTDAATLEIALMTLCGSINKQLVATLTKSGIPAVGLCGIDGGLLQAQKLLHPELDLGYVGEVVKVRTSLLYSLCTLGFTPVIAPISLGLDGQILNVNADQVASAIALALKAERLNFVSNVPGVLFESEVLPILHMQEAEEMIERGLIHDGMVPKVRAALRTLQLGVPNVRIGDLPALTAAGGTTFIAD
jgi:acetylglutamate kinase